MDHAHDDRLVLGLIDVLDLIAPGARATNWTPLPSRRSLVHRVDVTMPSGAETSLVVIRCDDTTTRDEALSVGATLERLRRGPVPAPEILWLDPDGVVFGSPAMALTCAAGTPGLDGDATAWATSVAATLADIHLFPGELLGHLPIVATPQGLLSRLGDRTPDALPRSAEVVDAVRTRAGEIVFQEARLVHGRVDHGSLLSSDGKVAGVVDWRGASRSDPRVDLGAAHALAWLLGGPDTASALVDAYVSRSGRAPDELAWFGLVSLLGPLGAQLDDIDGATERLDGYLDWALRPEHG